MKAPVEKKMAGTRMPCGWRRTAGDDLTTGRERAGPRAQGPAGLEPATGCKLAESRHLQATDWLVWLGWQGTGLAGTFAGREPGRVWGGLGAY